MAMSRKDYEAVAAHVRAVRAGVVGTEPVSPEDDRFCRGILAGTKLTAVALSNVFHNDNARFDRTRFLTACGVTDEATLTGLAGDTD